ncbi:hypothetical protein [Myxosarcina sp. GI1(2024)]
MPKVVKTDSNGTSLQLKKAIEEAQNKAKDKSTEKPPVDFAERVKVLSNHIADMPSFSQKEFLEITKLGEQTFRTWRHKGVKRPHDSTLNAMRRYLRIAEEPFQDYLRGKIDIDELWEHRNSDVGAKIQTNQFLSWFRLLDADDKLDMYAQLSSMLKEDVGALKTRIVELEDQIEEIQQEAEEKAKQQEFIELSDRARIRLKHLLSMTLTFKGQTEKDLIDLGADGALIESIQQDANDKYPKESFMSVASLLCTPIQWSNDYPVVDPNTAYGEAIDELVKELEEVGS